MKQYLVITYLIISTLVVSPILTVHTEHLVKTSRNLVSLLGVQIAEAARHHHFKQQNTNTTTTDKSDNENSTDDIPPANGNTTSPGCPPGYYNPRGCVYQ